MIYTVLDCYWSRKINHEIRKRRGFLHKKALVQSDSCKNYCFIFVSRIAIVNNKHTVCIYVQYHICWYVTWTMIPGVISYTVQYSTDSKHIECHYGSQIRIWFEYCIVSVLSALYCRINYSECYSHTVLYRTLCHRIYVIITVLYDYCIRSLDHHIPVW